MKINSLDKHGWQKDKGGKDTAEERGTKGGMP